MSENTPSALGGLTLLALSFAAFILIRAMSPTDTSPLPEAKNAAELHACKTRLDEAERRAEEYEDRWRTWVGEED